MLKKVIGSVLLVIVALVSYFTGYQQGEYGLWINSKNPPKPVVQIGENEVDTVAGGYGWCVKNNLLSGAKCSRTDSLSPRDMLKDGFVKPLAVKGGEEIIVQYSSKYKGSLRESSLRLLQDEEGMVESDPYIIPEEQGVYLYEIYSRWADDQGDSIHVFAVRVGD